MPLPSSLTFNELNGEEVKQVLENRCVQILDGVPYFQTHITLPRVRITLNVKLEIWADQPHPDTVSIGDKFTVIVERLPAEVIEAESVDTAAPVPGGHPPDKIREMHGLPISQPARGPQEVGGHITLSDSYLPLEGREVEDRPGLKVNRTGSGMIDGMPTSSRATVAKIDQGPAGLRAGRMDREDWHFGSKR
jgi:hypothetical protein